MRIEDDSVVVVRRQRSAAGMGSLCLALSALILALGSFSRAEQPTNVPRIGFLGVTSLSTISARIEGFRQGLRELGYDTPFP